MLLGFHHAQITVPPGRSDEVRAFYGGLLGLPELDLPPGFAAYRLIWFALGDRHQLHVSVDPDKPPTQTGMAHLAFESRGVGDWRFKLEAAGVETIDQPSMPGYDRFHVLDPFGNRLEFIEPTTPDCHPERSVPAQSKDLERPDASRLRRPLRRTGSFDSAGTLRSG